MFVCKQLRIVLSCVDEHLCGGFYIPIGGRHIWRRTARPLVLLRNVLILLTALHQVAGLFDLVREGAEWPLLVAKTRAIPSFRSKGLADVKSARLAERTSSFHMNFGQTSSSWLQVINNSGA